MLTKTHLRDSVYETLRELAVGFVCVDEPLLPSLLPPLTIGPEHVEALSTALSEILNERNTRP